MIHSRKLGLAVAQMGPVHLADDQHVFNFAQHRKPEHYRIIVERTGPGAPLPHDLPPSRT